MARTIQHEIIINAPVEQVWAAITQPVWTKQYMFGCETVSDWQVGSELLWRGEMEGQPMVFVKGHITGLEENQTFGFTTFDPNSDTEDAPENYLEVMYRLSQRNGQTRLTVTQGDYDLVADGDKRYQETQEGGGWGGVLEKIKELLEA
ncbi:MAG: SRPBCC domain-containing protein [Bacteroidota bacterium]